MPAKRKTGGQYRRGRHHSRGHSLAPCSGASAVVSPSEANSPLISDDVDRYGAKISVGDLLGDARGLGTIPGPPCETRRRSDVLSVGRLLKSPARIAFLHGETLQPRTHPCHTRGAKPAVYDDFAAGHER